MGKDYGSGNVITAQTAYHVQDGEKITNPTVSSAGVLRVYSGGTATQVVEKGGLVIVETGANVTFTPTVFSDLTLSSASNLGAAIHTATVHSGTTANRITLSSGYNLEVYSGGTANSTTVSYGCLLRVMDEGQANDNSLEPLGSLCVSNGGSANRTSGGFVYVSVGGAVTSTTVDSFLFVHEGAAATSTTIKTGSAVVDGDAYDTTISGGSMEVFSGATATRTTVSGGFLDVSSGALASSATVFAGGSVQVFSSGVANKVHLSGGRMMVSFGGIANSAVVSTGKLYVDGSANNTKVSGGSMEVYSATGMASGGTANNTSVTNNGVFYVSPKGFASNTKLLANGSMVVSEGGTADKTSVGGLAAYLQVDEGATVTDTTATEGDISVYGTATGGAVSANAQMTLYAGTANDVKVSKGGTLNVMANGTANDITVTSAAMIIKDTGTANAATIKTAGEMTVSKGGKASNTVVSSGSISVLSGGEVKFTDVKDQGILTVEKDGTADKTTIWEGGSMTLRGTATETAVLTYGQLTVSGGAQATKATVADNGTMTLEMGGSAIEATVYDGGALFVNAGGTATHTFLDDGAMYVSGGGSAAGVDVKVGGFLYLYKGAQATVVRESGGFVQTEAGANISFAKTTFTGLTITGDSATVHSNTKAVDTVLADNGRLYIHSGGTAAGTVVNNVGRFYLYSGGVASGATVNAGGSMTISSGAKATGKLTFAEGAVVSAYEGAKIDFDISGLSPDNAVLVNNLSLVTGSPDFTLTVGTQKLGTYALADGVTSFDGTITVFCNDFELGTISVGEGRKTVETMDYTLTLDGGVLSVTLDVVGEDTTPPTITDITLSTMEPGVASVTVTAVFADNVSLATKQYRIGAGEWQDYTDAGVAVTKNTTVYFKATDTAGNEATGSCTVSNIAGDPPDITPPVVSNVAADVTVPTTGSVTVTADFSDDVELKSRLYRLGGGEWTDYPEGGVAVTENGPVYFKAVDADGNESEVKDIVISNIDKKPPTITDFTLSTYAPAESVTVTAAFKDDVALASREYRIGDGEWLDYTAGVTVTQNALLAFRAADAVGNETVEYFAVTNIGTGAVDLTGGLDESHDLEADEVASGVSINDGGTLWVSSGAIALETTVNSGGDLPVCSGGIADVVTVNPGGGLYVYSGGAALKIRENGGYVNIRDGATATFVPNTFTGLTLGAGDSATVHSGTTATGITVNQGGYFFVASGGSATGIAAEEGARLILTVAPGTYQQGTYAGNAFEVAGGDVTGYAVHSGCQLYVSGGGVATDTTVEDYGWLRVLSGGTATGGTVASGGHLVVSDGGYATGIVAADGAVLFLTIAADTYQQGTYAGSAFAFGSAVTGITLQPHVNLEIGNGGTATGIGIGSGLGLDVNSGGTATEVTVEHGGTLNISSGGIATVTENGGNVNVYDGADVTFTPNTIDGIVFTSVATLHSGTTATNATVEGTVYVYGGGVVTGATVSSGGYLTISSGGIATGATVESNGRFYVYGGGIATVTENGGYVNVYDGADVTFTPNTIDGIVFTSVATLHSGTTATNATVKGGPVFVYSGGVVTGATVEGGLHLEGGSATDTTVNDGGYIYIFSGGAADNTTINSGGSLAILQSNGTAKDTTVNDGGIFSVYGSGNTANGVVVSSGGSLGLYGKLTGKAVFETGAIVKVGGAEIDFDLTQTTPGADPLVNDLSFVMDSGTTYTLTVNGTVTDGTYKLAGGATGFDKTITVQNTLGEGIGTLSAGDVEKEILGMQFTLALTGSDLTVTVSGGSALDITAPTVTNITASTTDPTKDNVTVTADFGDDVELKSSLYKLDGDADWSAYPEGGVVVDKNTTVYFKAVDKAGNECKPKFITIENIDKVAPTITEVKANTTEPDVASVTVTAVFADNVELSSTLYRIGDGAWFNYNLEGVTVTENTTVSFKATDTAGNVTTESYVVSNIATSGPDTTAPTVTVTPSATDPVTSVTLSATFSDNVGVVTKQYRIGDDVWKDYTDPVPVTENVAVGFRAVDAAGNETVETYQVTNIENEPENDWLFKKKKKTYVWNEAENIVAFTVNEVAAGNSMVYLDKKGSVQSEDGKYFNSLGRTQTEAGTVEDAADYAKIELAYGAALQFSVDSTVGGTFYVYQAVEDKNGNLVAKQKQKITVKANKTSPSKLTTVCLEAGEYFIGMEGKLPAAKKNPEVSAYYNVNLTGTKFFVDADSGSNNMAKDSFLATIGRGSESVPIILDSNAMTGSTEFKNFVGFTDPADYLKMDLLSSAYLKFRVTGEGDGKAKFTVWKRAKGTTGKLSKVTSVSLPAKKVYEATTKAQFLDTSKYDYYFSMECTDAKKGKGVYYNVQVTPDTVFFDSFDDGKNNVLYDKKAKAFYPEDATHHFETTSIGGGTKSVKLDSAPVAEAGYENFVGYQDAADYARIELTTDGNLSFDLKATGDATFVVYRKGQDKKGNDTLEAIQTTKLTLEKGKTVVEKFTDVLSDLTAGEYYVSMTAKNTKANAKGSTFYNVTATLDPSVSSALAMPETSDADVLADSSLNLTDALSFASLDLDALADASASALADLDDKSAWQNLTLA